MNNYTDRLQRDGDAQNGLTGGDTISPATQEGEGYGSFNYLPILEKHNPKPERGLPGWVLNAFLEYSKIITKSIQPKKEEGEDIRKAYLIMKDGVDLIGSCVSAILAYQKKETKESIIEELKKIRRTIDLVKEGTNKPHSSTLQAISTLPSTAENKEEFRCDDTETRCKQQCDWCRNNYSENKASGIDKKEEDCAMEFSTGGGCTCGKYQYAKNIPAINACPIHEKNSYKKQVSQNPFTKESLKENTTSVTEGKEDEKTRLVNNLLSAAKELLPHVNKPVAEYDNETQRAMDNVAKATDELKRYQPSEPSTIPVVDYEAEAMRFYPDNSIGMSPVALGVARTAHIRARQMSSPTNEKLIDAAQKAADCLYEHDLPNGYLNMAIRNARENLTTSDTNSKVKELIDWLELEIKRQELAGVTNTVSLKNTLEKANSLIQLPKNE